ncbi:MAG TPA: YciI family protein [Gammaproteobacteria bacterium]|nr:YciI family protein [Gammaproteobacteria bacterium]
MLYALLCYHDESAVWSWTQEQNDAVMAQIAAVQEPLIKAGKMGPSLRLLPTTTATTLRKTQHPPLVVDGPFAETKEQLLGFYIIDVDDLEAALDIARDLAGANPGGAYEIRPVALYNPDHRPADPAHRPAERAERIRS